ncbi:hypothetical protein PsYK624_034370 [Phanerochaete sordida]|uniref:Uncharacterized protein n=1 Tax=Phanerochaete sordida TaxID=48140 RepID=A0A9P3LAA9_9APHY|nr:hypothetical protein PsYK624_034370 [Phanerochaete sordida]
MESDADDSEKYAPESGSEISIEDADEVEDRSWDDPELVRENLELILGSKHTFQSQAYSSHRYNKAPNPVLTVSEFGIVTLPLISKTAEDLKNYCIQLSMEPQDAGADAAASSTCVWELPPESFTSLNYAWNSFMQDVCTDVGSAFCVDMDDGRITCESETLLLLGPGARIPHSRMVSHEDQVFAKIMVSLPSEFSGGSIHFRHEGESAHHESGPHNLLFTSVAAWYTAVHCDNNPITEGNRLVMLYNLRWASDAGCPHPPRYDLALSRLERILQAWKLDCERPQTPEVRADGTLPLRDSSRQRYKTPEQIMYLLKEQPMHHVRESDTDDSDESDTEGDGGKATSGANSGSEQSGKGASSLRGGDARRFRLLRRAADQQGFSLGFADASIQWLSAVTFTRIPGQDEILPLEWDDHKNEETRSMGPLRTAEGKLIQDDVSHDRYYGDSIPEDFMGEIFKGRWQSEYWHSDIEHPNERYLRYGYVTRDFTGQLLVVWPRGSSRIMRYQAHDGFMRACSDLEGHLHEPAETMSLARFILEHSDHSESRAAKACAKAACAWENLELWDSATALCAGNNILAIIPYDVMLKAVTCFGLDAVRPSFERFIREDSSTPRKLRFISTIRASGDASDNVKRWAANQVLDSLKSLQNLQRDDIPALLDTAVESDGVEFIRASMLEHVCVVAKPETLLDFSVALFDDPRFPVSDTKHAVVHDALSVAMSQASLVSKRDLRLAKRFITAILNASCFDLLSRVFNNLEHHIPSDGNNAGEYAATVMLPLLGHSLEHAKSIDATLATHKSSLDTSMRLYLDRLHDRANTPRGEPDEYIGIVLDTVLLSPDPGGEFARVFDLLKDAPLSAVDLRALANAVHGRREGLVSHMVLDTDSLTDIALSLGQRYALALALDSPGEIMSVLNWSDALGLPSVADIVLQRLRSVDFGNVTYISTILFVVLPKLKVWAVHNDRLADIRSTVQSVVSVWFEAALGPEPVLAPAVTQALARLTSWTCDCAQCTQVRNFLRRTGNHELVLESIGAVRRRHVEAEIATHASTLATKEIIYQHGPFMQGCRVSKTRPLLPPVLWRREKERGKEILSGLASGAEELSDMLGEAYNSIAPLVLSWAPIVLAGDTQVKEPDVDPAASINQLASLEHEEEPSAILDSVKTEDYAEGLPSYPINEASSRVVKRERTLDLEGRPSGSTGTDIEDEDPPPKRTKAEYSDSLMWDSLQKW